MDSQENFDQAAAGEHPIAQADLAIVAAAEPNKRSLPIAALGHASELADQPPLIAAACTTAIIGMLKHDRRLARTGIRMLAAHLFATGIKTIVKNNVDRSRPAKAAEDGEHELEKGRSDDGDKRSFPSEHTAGATAVARAIARDYPESSAAAYSLACAAALVQIPRCSHYPSDLAAGATIGIVAEAVTAPIIDFLIPMVPSQCNNAV